MPQITSDHFLAGYVRATMSQLRTIIRRLENTARSYDMEMLHDIHDEMLDIHAEIQVQLRLSEPQDAANLLTEYQVLSVRADEIWSERYRPVMEAERNAPSTSDGRRGNVLRRFPPGEKPAADVDSQSSVATEQPSTSQGKQNYPSIAEAMANIEKFKIPKKGKRKPKDKVKFNLEEFEDIEPREQDEYASDNENPMALEVLSRVNPAPGFRPIQFQRNDLRHRLENRRGHSDVRSSPATQQSSAQEGEGRSRSEQCSIPEQKNIPDLG